MADKEKRLRKLLSKLCIKGQFKLVAKLEEAHPVLIQDKRCVSRNKLTEKDSYLMAIEQGYIFPEEDVYYMVSTNPRNKQLVEQKYLTNAFANIKNK